MSRGNRIVATGLILLIALLAAANYSPYGLGWNVTPSVPKGLYLTHVLPSDASVSRGDIVCFRFVEPDWAAGRKYVPPGVLVCKPVAGLEGDSLEVSQGKLRVGPQGVSVSVAPVDSRGRPLYPAIPTTTVVPPGHVFLLAPQLTVSLDSRYLGAIPRTRLIKQLKPLWLLDSAPT